MATSHKDTRLACQNAFQAGVVHTGHDKKIKKYAKQKEREVRIMMGEFSYGFIAFYTLAIKQEAVFNVHKFAGTQSTVFKITPKQISIDLNWRF